MSIETNKKLGRRIAGNTAWILLQTIYQMLVQVVIGSLTARFLGTANYGLISYGASYVSLFTSISQLGLNAIIIQEIVTDENDSGEVMGTALIMRFFASLLSIAMIQIIVLVAEPGNEQFAVVTLLQAIALIFNAYDIFNSWFQIKLLSKFTTIALMCGITAVAVWRIVLLYNHASVDFFALSSTIQSFVCFLILGLFFWQYKQFKLSFSFKRVKDLFSKSHHLMLASIAITIYLQANKILLGLLMNDSAVGIYNSAATIANMWIFVPTAIIDSARPVILRFKTNDNTRYESSIKLLFSLLFLLGVVVAIIFTFGGDFVINLLYGEAYQEAIPVIKILIWSTLFSCLGTSRTVWLVGEGLYKYAQNFAIMGATLNVALCYLLIRLFGIQGAAYSTLITESTSLLVFPMVFSKTRRFDAILFSSIRQTPVMIKSLSKIKTLLKK